MNSSFCYKVLSTFERFVDFRRNRFPFISFKFYRFKAQSESANSSNVMVPFLSLSISLKAFLHNFSISLVSTPANKKWRLELESSVTFSTICIRAAFSSSEYERFISYFSVPFIRNWSFQFYLYLVACSCPHRLFQTFQSALFPFLYFRKRLFYFSGKLKSDIISSLWTPWKIIVRHCLVNFHCRVRK